MSSIRGKEKNGRREKGEGKVGMGLKERESGFDGVDFTADEALVSRFDSFVSACSRGDEREEEKRRT